MKDSKDKGDKKVNKRLLYKNWLKFCSEYKIHSYFIVCLALYKKIYLLCHVCI